MTSGIHALHTISIVDLAETIGRPNTPVLVDVCIDEDFEADPRLIPGAFRHPFNKINELASVLQDREVVVICQKGLKLSQGAAALLRAQGINARNLNGGNLAWRDAGLPLTPTNVLPPRDTTGRTTWVADEKLPAADIASAWVIRRFVDPRAQFLCVANDQCANVADRFSATILASDENAFAALIEQLCLDVSGLSNVGTMIAEPELKSILKGMALLHPLPNARIDAAIPFFDAIWAANTLRRTVGLSLAAEHLIQGSCDLTFKRE